MSEKISRKLIDLAWLAGILDGEGYFQMKTRKAHNNKYYLDVKIRLNNSDVRMTQKASEILHDLGVKFFYSLVNVKNKEWLTCIELRVDRQKNCLTVLEAVKPFMVNKQGQVNEMLNVIYYVKSVPKGGNTSSYPYVEYPHFKQLMEQFRGEFNWYYEPKFLSRRAHTALDINEDKQLVRHHHKIKNIFGEITPENLSWLAGIIDGEGSFYMYDKHLYTLQPYLDVTNTDVRMIRRVSKIFEAMNARFYYTFHNRKKIKDTYKNQLSIRCAYRGSLVRVLTALSPYLVNKKDQCNAMLKTFEFVEDYHKKIGGHFTKDSNYRALCGKFTEAKKWYQDPQRLIREANVPLDVRRESPIHVGDNVSTSERMCA